MKKILGTLVLSAASLCVYGQINMLRYNDNFKALLNDTVEKRGFEKLKYISILENVNVSFGGELREQYQFYQNRNFGDAPSVENSSNSDQLMQRVMVHANIDIGKKIRIFAQLGSTYRFLNPNNPIPEIDENHLSLHQTFIDYRFAKNWMARVGRQEIAYGSHRLITFREGPNTRLAFDAALIRYSEKRRYVDLFIVSPVTSKPGIFDDSTFKDIIYGGYATETLVDKKLLLDYYTMGFVSNRRSYNYVPGKENRQSYGIRIFSRNPKLNYEVETTYQSGRFNDLKIRAYSLSSDINYKFHSRSSSIIGLGSGYVSGDKDPNDKRLNTYNLLFSKPQYGLAAPIGATNIINVTPYLSSTPIKGLNLTGGISFMWRQSSRDGTYSPLGTETRPKLSLMVVSKEKEIGELLYLETSCAASKHLTVSIDASYFFAGRYVKETGKGKNISYLSLKMAYRF